jgi:hypothetical protein
VREDGDSGHARRCQQRRLQRAVVAPQPHGRQDESGTGGHHGDAGVEPRLLDVRPRRGSRRLGVHRGGLGVLAAVTGEHPAGPG